jgi:hypothetical protein
MNRRARLCGGPCDGRIIDDVPDSTENIQIPHPVKHKIAHYRRVGDSLDAAGMFWRFDFQAIHDADTVIRA